MFRFGCSGRGTSPGSESSALVRATSVRFATGSVQGPRAALQVRISNFRTPVKRPALFGPAVVLTLTLVTVTGVLPARSTVIDLPATGATLPSLAPVSSVSSIRLFLAAISAAAVAVLVPGGSLSHDVP